MTLTDIELPAHDDVRRNYHGQYLCVPPAGKKPAGYQRVTTLIKTLEDRSSLEQWSSRMVLLGAAERADLRADAILHRDNRDKLNELAEQAKEVGGGTVRRNLGTAMHKMLERKHEDPSYEVPGPWRADIDAATTRIDTAGFDVVTEYSEQIVVLDAIKVAGKCDLVLRRRSDGKLFVADFKTGSSVKYGTLGWSAQLTCYAMADAIYVQGDADDGSEDRRLPAPDVSRETAFILHCQPESGQCEMYELKLDPAFVDLAVQIRETRKLKSKLLTKIEGGGDTDAPDADRPTEQPVEGAVEATNQPVAATPDPRTAWLLERIEVIKAIDAAAADLGSRLPDGHPTPKQIRNGAGITDAGIDAYVAVLDGVEARHSIPFGPPDPTIPEPTPTTVDPPAPPPKLTAGRSTGPPVAQAKAQELRTLAGRFDGLERDVLFHWLQDAKRHKLDPKMPTNGDVPWRVYEINAALLEATNLVTAEDTDTGPRAALALVMGDDAHQPIFPVGALVASLTAEQAHQLVEVCRTHRLADSGDQDTPTLVAV